MCAHDSPEAARGGLADAHGRRICYIRLSLTDRCNFRCIYCMPPEGQKHIPHAEILTYEELLRFCRISAGLGIGRYKITGGEPLCRKGAVPFISALKQLPGVEQVTLTTNGSLLLHHLDGLSAAGIDGVNVSLDTLSPERYQAITGASLAPGEIVRAIRETQARGIAVKINAVPLMGHNDRDLLPLARFALENGCHLRFIELMPIGRGRAFTGVPDTEIRRRIEKEFGPLTPLGRRIGNGPAEYFSIRGYPGSIGFIAALSKKFCHACNRVRLTAPGYLKVCLHHGMGRGMKPLLRGGASDQDIAEAVAEAVRQKPFSHFFEGAPEPGGPGSFFMNSVGG